MADAVDLEELDASDLADILSEVNGKATKVKNVAAARKELAALLETKRLVLTTDDEGNFVLNAAKPAKAKAKAKAAPPPEPEEDEEEAEEEAEEEEADEEEAEEEPPPPKAKTKAKAKAAPPEPEEDEEEAEEEAEEEEEAPKKKAKAKDGTKRPPPPREPTLKDNMTITIVNKTPKFAEGSFRARKWEVLKKSKTVGAYMKAAEAAELPSARGFLSVCMKAEYITIG